MRNPSAWLQNNLSRHGRKWPLFLAYVVVPLLIGFWVIAGVFNNQGDLPIDGGDEPAETFVQVPMALSRLVEHHEILKINLYNNFGNPILGEPVVYPYALHAWTYLFFSPAKAMLVNKFLLSVFTMIVLTAFFSRYSSLLVSSLCAFLAFSARQFLYFFNNHPHQGALLYFGLILIAARRFLDQPTMGRGVCLYLAFLIFLFSVGVHGTLLAIPFIVAYIGWLAGRRWKLALLALGLFLAAFVAVWPHFAEFFRLAAESARKDLNYQAVSAIPPGTLFRNLLVDESDFNPSGIFYAWPILLLVLVGTGFAAADFRRAFRANATDRTLLRQQECGGLLFGLGLLPCLMVLLFRFFPGLLDSIPVLKAGNISRVLWFSDIFLMLTVGLALRRVALFFLRYHFVSRALVLMLLAVCFFPRGVAFQRSTLGYLVNEQGTVFEPAGFLPALQPYTRLAGFIDPTVLSVSADTKANTHQILGSAGRSIILNKTFRDYLLKSNLIGIGYHGMTYYFLPAAPDTLARFGIRYGLVFSEKLDDPINDKMIQSGWKKLGSAENNDHAQHLHMVLYASPFAITPFYTFVQPDRYNFLSNYHLGGNEMDLTLPPNNSPCQLTATFLARPGWKAFLNGQPVKIESAEDCFIHVDVPASSDDKRILLLKYEPYTDATLIGGLVLSLLLGGFLSWRAKFFGSRSPVF